MKILIVEDHELLARALAAALGVEGVDVDVVLPHTGADVIEAVRTTQPDTVVLDLHLGFAIGNGLGLIGPLIQEGAPVVVLTADSDPQHTAAAVAAGAKGVLHKSRPFEDLVSAVTDAAAGRPLLTDSHRDEIVAALDGQADDPATHAFTHLTPREEEVLVGLMEGKNAQAIAETLTVSVSTVRAQLASLRSKLGVHSQLAAAALAMRWGWTPREDASPIR